MRSGLPVPETPLYNHTLPSLEQWLNDKGCDRDDQDLHVWHVTYPLWSAEVRLEIEEVLVTYTRSDSPSETIRRSFKYSLSRQDVEEAVFSGP